MLNFIIKLFKKPLKPLPKEGTTFTINDKRSAYNGMSGIVHHHLDGEHFMIYTGTAWLCNIKP